MGGLHVDLQVSATHRLKMTGREQGSCGEERRENWERSMSGWMRGSEAQQKGRGGLEVEL